VELTPDDVGDITMVSDLLDLIDGSIASLTGDGAYNADEVYDEIERRHLEADIIIPPRSTAVVSESGISRRDAHLRTIDKRGRIGWQRRSGYGRRSLVETVMLRYKSILGRRPRARSLANQKTEAKIGCVVFNRMTGPRHAGLHPYQMNGEPKEAPLPRVAPCTNACKLPELRISLDLLGCL
jgi:Transposase DDE domain